MHQRDAVVVVCVCVCVSVCLLLHFGDIIHLYVTTIVITFAQYSLDFNKHDFCDLLNSSLNTA